MHSLEHTVTGRKFVLEDQVLQSTREKTCPTGAAVYMGVPIDQDTLFQKTSFSENSGKLP